MGRISNVRKSCDKARLATERTERRTRTLKIFEWKCSRHSKTAQEHDSNVYLRLLSVDADLQLLYVEVPSSILGTAGFSAHGEGC